MRHSESNNWLWALLLAAAVAPVGCSDDDEDAGPMATGGATTGGSGSAKGGAGAGTGGRAAQAGMAGTPSMGTAGANEGGAGGGMGGAGGASVEGVRFTVRIENVGTESSLRTPISPGVWVLSNNDEPLFTAGKADRGEGLEAIAEDGNPAELAGSLANDTAISRSGVFDTPVDTSKAGAAVPGKAFEFELTALPEDGGLSFATMFGQSNDAFFAPAMPIPLFDDDGEPVSGDFTNSVALWSSGTEQDEAPTMGNLQAPRQPEPNSGPAEGVVSAFASATRSVPSASRLVEVEVSEDGGRFSLTFRNVSAQKKTLVSPISPIFFATHDDTYRLFVDGERASAALERLAEDGSPAELAAEADGSDGILESGAATIPDEADSAGPALPGSSFSIDVAADEDHPWLSFATMVGNSNDAFLALPPSGVRLFDESGQMRSAEDVEEEIRNRLAVWDAGSESNEVIGVGRNQAPRQPAPDTGPADENDVVRRYSDATNDLAGEAIHDFVAVSVAATDDPETFEVTIENVSADSAYPGLISPTAWAVHDGELRFFETDEPASEALERLAEDGNSMLLAADFEAESGVLESGVVAMATDASEAGPLMPGKRFVFMVHADAEHRFLGLASMLVPSNDAFMALSGQGVALLNSDGSPRSADELEDDIRELLRAWDAGTEANQAAAAGADQAPQQSAPDTGTAEGNGMVRAVDTSVWDYPAVPSLIRVTITPTP
jgi:hypothetical protein